MLALAGLAGMAAARAAEGARSETSRLLMRACIVLMMTLDRGVLHGGYGFFVGGGGWWRATGLVG